jgi:hypothetical protein
MEKNKKGWFCVTDFTNVEPNLPGFYAIYKLNVKTGVKKLLYIGTAMNLAKRLSSHEIKRTLYGILEYPEFVMVKCKIFESSLPNRRSLSWYSKDSQLQNERMRIESSLIRRLKPPLNKDFNHGRK